MPSTCPPRRRPPSHLPPEMLETRIAPAATFLWRGGSGNWEDASHWDAGQGVGASGYPGLNTNDVAKFDTASGSPTVTMTQDETVELLLFNGTGSPTIGGAGRTLHFAGSAAIVGIQLAAVDGVGAATGSATVNVNVDVEAMAIQDFRLINANPATGSVALKLNGVLTSTVADHGPIVKSGPGAAIFGGSASNTFSDGDDGTGLTVEDGVLRLAMTSGATAVPGTLSITGGLVTIVNAEQIADTSNVRVQSPGQISLGAAETIHQLSGDGNLVSPGNAVLKLQGDSSFDGTLATALNKSFSIDLDGHDLTLTGDQPSGFTAALNFKGGQVNVDGDFGSTSIVLQGGTSVPVVSGTGTLGSVSTTAPAYISPGSGRDNGTDHATGTGTLTVKGTLSNGAGTLSPLLDFAGAGGHDLFILQGNGALNTANASIVMTGSLTAAEGALFTLVDVQNGHAVAPFNGLADNTVIGTGTDGHGHNVSFSLHYHGGTGDDVTITADPILAVLAPTSLAAKSATFLMEDGDTLTIKTNRGTFTAANFSFVGSGGASAGGNLLGLDVSAAHFGSMFKGATLTATVTKGTGGDGFANIGYVNATGVDLGCFVATHSDLGQIDAGDADFKTAGLGALSVLSFGTTGVASQGASDPLPGLLTSTIVGQLKSLSVTKGSMTAANTPSLPAAAGTMANVFLDVVADGTAANYKYASIGKATLDNLTGTLGTAGSAVYSANELTYTPGSIRAEGRIVQAVIGNGLTGGATDFSGDLWSRSSIGTVSISPLSKASKAGFITGGDGLDSGSILAGNPDLTGTTLALKLGTVTLNGSLTGGSGPSSGTLYADGGISKVVVTGNVLGSGGTQSGAIISGKGIGSVSIQGSLTGSDGPFSGSISAQDGNVGSITITNGIKTGDGFTGIFIKGTLGTLTTGALDGSASGGTIQVRGAFDAAAHPRTGAAIAKIVVRGNVNGWTFAAGASDQGAGNPYAGIGSVTVNGNFIHSNILAAVDTTNGVAGDGNDLHLAGGTKAGVFSTIASVIVTGESTNSVFEAQVIKAMSLDGTKVKLTAGRDTLTPPTGNVVTELA